MFLHLLVCGYGISGSIGLFRNIQVCHLQACCLALLGAYSSKHNMLTEIEANCVEKMELQPLLLLPNYNKVN